MFGGWKDRFKFNGQNFSQNDFKRILREGGNHFGLDLPQFVADDTLVNDLGNVTELILDILTRRENESIDALVREIAKRLGTFGTGYINEAFFRRLFAALKARYDAAPASSSSYSPYVPPPPPPTPARPIIIPDEVLAPPRPLPIPLPAPAPLPMPRPAALPLVPRPPPVAPPPGYLDALDRIVDFGAPAPPNNLKIESAIIDCWSMDKIESEYQRRYFQAYRNVINGKLGIVVQNYEEILIFAFFDIETKRMDGATPAESIRNLIVALKKTMRFSFEKIGDVSVRLTDAERRARDDRYQPFLAAIDKVLETIE